VTKIAVANGTLAGKDASVMDQEERLKDSLPADPVKSEPVPQEPEEREPGKRRRTWPLLIIVLAGLVLALIAWLPAELWRDVEDVPAITTTQPSTNQPATPPVAPGATPSAPETQPQSTPEAPATPDTAPQPPAQ
jgi:hypothetical protein